MPYTFRNPLYHWTHLELKTAFGINKILNPKTAREIYDECNEKLAQPEYSARGMMRRYHVETVCTTVIRLIRWNIISKRVKADLKSKCYQLGVRTSNGVEVPADFRAYVEKLSEVAVLLSPALTTWLLLYENVTISLQNKDVACPTMVSKNFMQKIILM